MRITAEDTEETEVKSGEWSQSIEGSVALRPPLAIRISSFVLLFLVPGSRLSTLFNGCANMRPIPDHLSEHRRKEIMHRPKYLTAPIATEHMPPGVPYIIGNECAERFSFYGMKAILVVFMTQYLLNHSGELAVMSETRAKIYYHAFVWAVYFLPLLGAIIADAFLGKYRTILYLSIVYCFGHLALAVDETRVGLFTGLALIALGSGGIKPCVSANVGDQFGATNQHLLKKVFAWFYFSINFGSFFSTLLTPWLLEKYGPHIAFGVPGVLMLLATIIFWMGRNKYVHIPPGGWGFVRETFSGEGLRVIGRLTLLYVCVAMFWSLFEQTGSAWVLQAKNMELEFLGVTWLPSQVQAVNPILVMAFIPLFTYVVYPAIDRVFALTPLRKISIGFFLTSLSFALSTWIEQQIVAGYRPNIGWQVLAYVILTAAEVMVSITGLEFSYTQAPKKMKSLIMSVWLMAVALGSAFTVLINWLMEIKVLNLEGPSYYLFFTVTMLITAVVFVFIAMTYQPRLYIQDEAPAPV